MRRGPERLFPLRKRRSQPHLPTQSCHQFLDGRCRNSRSCLSPEGRSILKALAPGGEPTPTDYHQKGKQKANTMLSSECGRASQNRGHFDLCFHFGCAQTCGRPTELPGISLSYRRCRRRCTADRRESRWQRAEAEVMPIGSHLI